MSNRFHNKWHRRNHHTYGNSQNPDAAHDPIASNEQPFLGDFILSGALSGVAPASAFAAFFYSNFTALCAWAGRRGAYIFSAGNMGAEIYSTKSTAISAYGPDMALYAASPFTAISANGGFIGINTRSSNIGLSAYGPNHGIKVASPIRAISANGGFIGLDVGSTNTAISANGTVFGIQVYSPVRAISANSQFIGLDVRSNSRAISAYGISYGLEVSSQSRAISAQSNFIGLDVTSSNRAISAYGAVYGLEVSSQSRAISAQSNFIGLDVTSSNIAISAFGSIKGLDVSSMGTALSATGDKFAGVFTSNSVCLSTAPWQADGWPDNTNPYYGPNYITKNVFNNRTGIFTENPLSAFHVTGGSLFDGNMTITGDLSVNGGLSRFDTYVFITSSTQINVVNNTSGQPALYVSDSGDQSVFVAYDADYSLSVPSFIVDGYTARAGNIGMSVAQPTVRLDISNDITKVPQTASSGTVVHVSQSVGSNNRLLLDAFGSSGVSRSSFTGRQAGINSGTGALSGVPNNAVLCEFTGQGYGATGYSSTSRGRMTINSAEAWGDSNQGTYLTFQTTPIGGIATAEVVRIDDNGNVGINVKSPVGAKLTVSGSLSSVGGNVSINDTGSSTTNINNGADSSGTVNIATGVGALNVGNATGSTTINGNTLSVTSAGTLNINSSTGKATNVNTGTGAVTTTIGNNTASNVTTINSPSITAPNQTYIDGTSVITGSLGDSRYNQRLFSTTIVNSTSAFAVLTDAVKLTLAANKTYYIEVVAASTFTGTTQGVEANMYYTGTASNTLLIGRNGINSSSTGNQKISVSSLGSAGLLFSGNLIATTTTNTTALIFVTGTITTTNGGDLSLQIKLSTTGGVVSITNLPGSIIRATVLN